MSIEVCAAAAVCVRVLNRYYQVFIYPGVLIWGVCSGIINAASKVHDTLICLYKYEHKLNGVVFFGFPCTAVIVIELELDAHIWHNKFCGLCDVIAYHRVPIQ